MQENYSLDVIILFLRYDKLLCIYIAAYFHPLSGSACPLMSKIVLH